MDDLSTMFALFYGLVRNFGEKMSDHESGDKPKGIEEQLKEMLGNAKFIFAGQPEPSTAKPDNTKNENKPKKEATLKAIEKFDLKPRDVRDYLDRFVIRQDEAKKVLSVAICDHYNHVRQCLVDSDLRDREYIKHNVLLLGPTGVGKTYLIKCMARLIGVPFVKADATKFSETGYVGHDVEDLVRDLVKVADGDVGLAQYGIVFIDEVDKIAATGSGGGKDVSGRGVQVNLLKLMEETDVSLFSQTDIIGQMQAVMDMQRGGSDSSSRRTVNTRHILFIVSGAFGTLAEQVKKRVSSSPIGFSGDKVTDVSDGEYLRKARTGDFVTYGFEPEFIGRLPVRVVCDALDAGDLQSIMEKAEGNIIEQYASDFRGYNIELSMATEAIKAIAELAYQEKTGARGLTTILEKIFRDFKFELPSTGIKELKIDLKSVKEPEQALLDLLDNKESVRREVIQNDIDLFAAKFRDEHKIKLVINKTAREAISVRCLADNLTVKRWVELNFHDLEYALNLISRNTGKKSFSITKKLVENTEKELADRIAASFNTKV